MTNKWVEQLAQKTYLELLEGCNFDLPKGLLPLYNALSLAHEQGRVEGLEEAAIIAEDCHYSKETGICKVSENDEEVGEHNQTVKIVYAIRRTIKSKKEK